MLRGILTSLAALFVTAQNTGGPTNQTQLVFTDTTTVPIVGNYTFGYINNTVQNRCHRGVAKFQAKQTGVVDSMTMGVYSRAQQETCGISFVLSTFPAGVVVGSSLLTTFTDLVASRPGTDEFIPFNVTPSSWGVVEGMNYTITTLPFTWATGPAGTVQKHCEFDVPYGRPGIPYFFLGEYGPTALPCGSTPWVIEVPGDGLAMQIKLTGHPASVVVPSPSSSHTPTPTSTITPTPSSTSTPTPSPTPTGTPSNTETPTPTLSPGATASNSPTSTRTPSRTPSISYTPTPTSSVTSSITPSSTPSPTPSLRIGSSPSVTPTETPGPTDSHSPRPVAGIAAPPPAAPAETISTGHLVGAAVGGALVVLALIGLAVRLKIVHAEINGSQKTKLWKASKAYKAKFEDVVPIQNPTLSLRMERVQQANTV